MSIGTPMDGAGSGGFGTTGRGRIGGNLAMDKGRGQVEIVRATGHKTPGESSVVLQSVVMIQLTSRRILRD